MIWPFFICIILVAIIGLYCLLFTFNLIRALIGFEILMKAVTLLIIVAGYASGQSALAQSLVITLIVIEVVLVTVAMGIVLGLHKHYKSLDVRNLRNLKG